MEDNNDWNFWDRLMLGFALGGAPGQFTGVPFTLTGWNTADKFDQKKGESGFYNDGKSDVLKAVDIVGKQVSKPFDWIKTVLILIAIILVATTFLKTK